MRDGELYEVDDAEPDEEFDEAGEVEPATEMAQGSESRSNVTAGSRMEPEGPQKKPKCQSSKSTKGSMILKRCSDGAVMGIGALRAKVWGVCEREQVCGRGGREREKCGCE